MDEGKQRQDRPQRGDKQHEYRRPQADGLDQLHVRLAQRIYIGAGVADKVDGGVAARRLACGGKGDGKGLHAALFQRAAVAVHQLRDGLVDIGKGKFPVHRHQVYGLFKDALQLGAVFGRKLADAQKVAVLGHKALGGGNKVAFEFRLDLFGVRLFGEFVDGVVHLLRDLHLFIGEICGQLFQHRIDDGRRKRCGQRLLYDLVYRRGRLGEHLFQHICQALPPFARARFQQLQGREGDADLGINVFDDKIQLVFVDVGGRAHRLYHRRRQVLVDGHAHIQPGA